MLTSGLRLSGGKLKYGIPTWKCWNQRRFYRKANGHKRCIWKPGKRWEPSLFTPTRIDGTGLHTFPANQGTSICTDEALDTYEQTYRKSINDPQGFWAEAGEQLVWHRNWDKVLDNSNSPFTKWFAGGQLNICYNALDRHIAGDETAAEKVAIVHDSPVTKTVRQITYRELHRDVCKMAAGLRQRGLQRGDTLLIYMPMIPEAIITMLACARLGAVHSLVFGGFAAKELAVRIQHCQPKVIVSANCGVEPGRIVDYKSIVNDALSLVSSSTPPKCIIYQRPQFDNANLNPNRDISWEEHMSKAPGGIDCEPVDAQHPLYILYTSGTTGDPKGVVRPSGGHAVALDWSMNKVYGMDKGDVWWAASDLGWVVGHSYICYGPLLRGLTSILYEGKPVGTPNCEAYFRVISQHNVNALFTAPTALRAIRKEDPDAKRGAKYNLKTLRHLFVAGEHCDGETYEWGQKVFGVPVVDNWWQTETGSPITCGCAGLTPNIQTRKQSSGKPVPGWKFKVMKEDNTEGQPGELGRIVAELPLPPGFMSTLYKNDAKYVEMYFQKYPGHYDTMDAGIIDAEGFVYVMSRDDDIINVAGHRISTKALEEALLYHPDLVECAVIGVPDHLKGQTPVGLYVLRDGIGKSEAEVSAELVTTVRRLIGPVAAFKNAICVNALPKTRSGKIARKTMADMASGRAVKIPSTIEDSSVYNDIMGALQKYGFAKGAPDPSH